MASEVSSKGNVREESFSSGYSERNDGGGVSGKVLAASGGGKGKFRLV